jgi:hypothetical protein
MLPPARVFLRAVAAGVLVLFSGCGSSSSPASPTQPPVIQLDQANTPPWQGGWTVIGAASAVVRLAQTFAPSKSALAAVEIDLITANPSAGSAQVTVRVVDENRALVSATQTVVTGFDGMLRFDFPSVNVTPGRPLQIQVADSSDRLLGWRYGSNTYATGVAFFNGTPWNGGAHDFFFRTYGY